MQSDLWANLPLLVLACIIDATADAATVDSWCQATRRNRYLYRAALARKYLDSSYNHRDLLDDPGERPLTLSLSSAHASYGRGFRHLMQVEALEQAGELQSTDGIATATTRDDFGLVPARMIRRLRLDFTLPFLDAGKLFHPDVVRAHAPSVHKLAYNAGRLFPLLDRVESVDVDGVAPQQLLDAMTAIPSRALRSLVYRSTPPSSRRPLMPKYRDLWVDWTSLAALTSLRKLVIQELGQDDGGSLARSIAALSQLEHLELVITKTKPSLIADSPMVSLVRGLFPCRSWPDEDDERYARPETCRLPRSLRVLRIVDNWESPVFGLEYPDAAQTGAYHSLTDVSIDLQDSLAVTNMFAWLGQSPIAQLAINCGDQGTSEAAASYTAHVDHVLRTHDFSTSLQSVQLLSAWEAHADLAGDINKAWAGRAAVTDLVLGSKSRMAYKMHFANRHDLNTLERVLFGYSGPDEKHRWGSALERARIEQVDMTSFAVDDSTDAVFPRLKVLQLNPVGTPWDGRNCDQEAVNETERTEGLLSFTEGRLAMQIVGLFPSVRVVGVGRHTYWVQHADGIRLWDFADAMEDAALRPVMDSLLNADDLDFLRQPCATSTGERERDTPCVQSCRQNNYMVIRPVTAAAEATCA